MIEDGEAGSRPPSDALADTLAAPEQLAAGSAPATPGLAAQGPRLTPGTAVGRYLITGLLGTGGMSVVYSARDPELNRDVAVKLLETGGHGQQDRLLREAHALARLAHPNVVVVHDVGTFGGQVFLVQEHLDGGTLGAWKRAVERSWKEILDRYLLAGRGLAAAHAAGLVHRDFKPDNVLLGSDGRLRVVDFGLVRPAGESGEATGVPDGTSAPSSSPLDSALTATGAVMGTPAYMAPEQHQGLATDPRSDQFSFCVALWTDLYGGHPFGGRTRSELAARIAAGRIVAPPAGRGVPVRLRRTLERGLSADPAHRFPSMDALLDELGRDPARRRRLVGLVTAGALAGAGLVLATLLMLPDAPAPAAAAPTCGDGTDRLAGVWGDAERAGLQRAFAATGLPAAHDATARTSAALDEWAAALAAEYRDACEATHVRQVQSEQMLDRRVACLDRRRREAGALIAALGEGDREAVIRAVGAVRGLPPPAHCQDRAEQLMGIAPPPAAQAAAVERIEAWLERIDARVQLGRLAEAEAEYRRAVSEARATGHRPLIAAAYFGLGAIEHKLGRPQALDSLEEAVLAAESSHDDLTAARVLTLIVEALAYAGHFDEARRRARHAEAAIQRLGGDREVGMRLVRSRAALALQTDAYDEAEKLWEQAIAHDRQQGQSDTLAADQSNLAAVYLNMGRYDDGIALMRQVADHHARTLGPSHPRLAGALESLATAMLQLGKPGEAEPLQRRALAIYAENEGEDSENTLDARTQLATIHWYMGELAAARTEFDALLADLGRLRPADHDLTLTARGNYVGVLGTLGDYPRAEAEMRALIEARRRKPASGYLATDLSNLSSILHLRGHDEEAVALAREALAMFARTEKAGHPSAGYASNNLADGERGLGRLGDAERDYRQAQQIFEAAWGQEHPALAYPLTGLGQIHLTRGQAAKARPLLERALALRSGGDPFELGETQFALARALAATGDRTRAMELGRAARDSYAAAGARGARERGRIDDWLVRLR